MVRGGRGGAWFLSSLIVLDLRGTFTSQGIRQHGEHVLGYLPNLTFFHLSFAAGNAGGAAADDVALFLLRTC